MARKVSEHHVNRPANRSDHRDFTHLQYRFFCSLRFSGILICCYELLPNYREFRKRLNSVLHLASAVCRITPRRTVERTPRFTCTSLTKMPAARKRSLREVAMDNFEPPAPPSMLHRIRNMWQFANLFQFILLFGKALKMDDNLDIEVCFHAAR